MKTLKKLIIFDIDGTLTDSLPLYHKVVIKSLKIMGINDIDTDFNNYKYHTDSYTLKFNYEKYFGKHYSQFLLTEFENILHSELKKYPPISEIKGAKKCIDTLIESGFAITFATGSLLKPAKLKLEQCSIWYDESLIATSEISFDRETFVKQSISNAMSFYQIDHFDKIYSIGDGVWDLQTAERLDLDFIGIGQKNKKQLIELGCKIYFDDLSELASYLI
jgi:phosphoglycolate phosphatase-like HAD superfamily hydrolase